MGYRRVAASLGLAALVCLGCNPLGIVGIGNNLTGEWLVVRPTATLSLKLTENGGKLAGSLQNGLASLEGTRSFSSVLFDVRYSEGWSTNWLGTISADGQQVKGYIAGDPKETFTLNRLR